MGRGVFGKYWPEFFQSDEEYQLENPRHSTNQTSNIRSMKNTVLRNIKIKLIKIYDKETILKAARKDTLHIEG